MARLVCGWSHNRPHKGNGADDGFVALCPEVDVASQGDTIEEARQNLREAVELFLETADPSEIEDRLHPEIYVTQFALAVG